MLDDASGERNEYPNEAMDPTIPWDDDVPIFDFVTNLVDDWLIESVVPSETEIRSEMSGHELLPPMGFSSWGMYEAESGIRGARWNFDADWIDSNCTARKPFSSRLKLRIACQNYRAAKLGLVADLTIGQWIATCIAFNNTCAYCGSRGTPHTFIIEHLVPVVRGGGTTRTNIVPSCSACNGSKTSKHAREWAGDARADKINAILGGMS
jgi:HNH endonuclease